MGSLHFSRDDGTWQQQHRLVLSVLLYLNDVDMVTCSYTVKRYFSSTCELDIELFLIPIFGNDNGTASRYQTSFFNRKLSIDHEISLIVFGMVNLISIFFFSGPESG